jgi:hypothetical protein
MDVMDAYKQLPVVTRSYVTLCVVTTAACALDVSCEGICSLRTPLALADRGILAGSITEAKRAHFRPPRCS